MLRVTLLPHHITIELTNRINYAPQLYTKKDRGDEDVSLLRQPLMTNGYKLHLPMAWAFPRGILFWMIQWLWNNKVATGFTTTTFQFCEFGSYIRYPVTVIAVRFDSSFDSGNILCGITYVIICLLLWLYLITNLSPTTVISADFKHKTSRYVQNTVHWKWNGSSLSSKSCASISLCIWIVIVILQLLIKYKFHVFYLFDEIYDRVIW